MTRIDGKIALIPVAHSSHVAALGYDPRQCVAYVEYANGTVCQYSPVKRSEWAMLALSPSKGTAVWTLKRNPNVLASRVTDDRINR